MFETFRYETERRLRGTAVAVVGASAFAVFIVALFPSVEAAAVDVERLVEMYPEPLREAFGIEAIGTVEGFLAGEFYGFVWVLVLGLYVAYRGGGIVAGDVERDRMDLLLSLPHSRSRLLAEKFASALVPVVALNAAVPVVVYASVRTVGESIDPVALAMVHLLSVPYLLACASLGLVTSVLVDRADVAQRGATGLVFALYLVESVAASVESVDALQYLSPTAYYEPSAVLVREVYAVGDAAVLVAASLALLALARSLFRRRDV